MPVNAAGFYDKHSRAVNVEDTYKDEANPCESIGVIANHLESNTHLFSSEALTQPYQESRNDHLKQQLHAILDRQCEQEDAECTSGDDVVLKDVINETVTVEAEADPELLLDANPGQPGGVDELIIRKPKSQTSGTSQVNGAEPVTPVASSTGTREYHEVTKEQLRRIMPFRWNANSPPLKKGMTSEQREKVLKARVQKEALFSDYTRRLNDVMKEYGINTPVKQAMFLATVAAESIEMTAFRELPSKYASSKSIYKGRGLIQITHENNYLEASQALKIGNPHTKPPYKGLVEKPELAESPKHAFPIAGWFWSKKPSGRFKESPNSLIGDKPRDDLHDFREASSLINSGQKDGLVNHWGTRVSYYKRALETLGVEVNQTLKGHLDDAIETYKGSNHRLPVEPSFRRWRAQLRAARTQKNAAKGKQPSD